MKKGTLQNLIDKKFEGLPHLAANEMVRLFCEKHNISGSVGSYNFYEKVQKLWEEILGEEKKYWRDQEELWKRQKRDE